MQLFKVVLTRPDPCTAYPLPRPLQADDVPAIISSKAGLKYVGEQVDAMKAVSKAYRDRSLQEFQVRGGGRKKV